MGFAGHAADAATPLGYLGVRRACRGYSTLLRLRPAGNAASLVDSRTDRWVSIEPPYETGRAVQPSKRLGYAAEMLSRLLASKERLKRRVYFARADYALEDTGDSPLTIDQK